MSDAEIPVITEEYRRIAKGFASSVINRKKRYGLKSVQAYMPPVTGMRLWIVPTANILSNIKVKGKFRIVIGDLNTKVGKK